MIRRYLTRRGLVLRSLALAYRNEPFAWEEAMWAGDLSYDETMCLPRVSR